MAGGYAIGIIGASGQFDTTGTETEGGGDKEQTSGSETEGLQYGSMFAEYSFGEMYGMTLGVSYTPVDSSLGAKSRTDTASDANDPGSSDAGTYRAEAEISNHATIYVEPTYMPSDNFGVYLKGGVARVNVTSLENIALGDDSSAYGNETVLGGLYGLGVKVVHDSGILLKLEYMRINYQTVELTSTTGNSNSIKAEPVQEAVRIAIGYKF